MNEDLESGTELWARLAERHRQESAGLDSAVPFGFAVRVAARWRELRAGEVYAAWERLSLRAALGSSVVALVVAGFSFQWERAMTGEEEFIMVPASGGEETEWLLP